MHVIRQKFIQSFFHFCAYWSSIHEEFVRTIFCAWIGQEIGSRFLINFLISRTVLHVQWINLLWDDFPLKWDGDLDLKSIHCSTLKRRCSSTTACSEFDGLNVFRKSDKMMSYTNKVYTSWVDISIDCFGDARVIQCVFVHFYTTERKKHQNYDGYTGEAAATRHKAFSISHYSSLT